MSLRAAIVPLTDVPHAWAAAWDALAVTAGDPNPFYERGFLLPAITHLPAPVAGHLATVWDGDVMIGLVPLHVCPTYGRTPARHIENWLHYNAFDGVPLIARDRAVAFWTTLLPALDAAPWAPGFLHLTTIAADAAALSGVGRPAPVVHRSERALLKAGLSATAYYETHVRKKKRKELGRLQSRLRELGPIVYERLPADADVAPWADAFLALEAKGWKGTRGAALGKDEGTRAFFHDALAGAHAAGRLEMIAMRVGGATIAMLVNFLTAPGSFSFKIAFDEDYARYSPGVLIEIENLGVVDGGPIAWMDSCAIADHSMINSLWADRRAMVRVTIPLAGMRRRMVHTTCRTLERGAALMRRFR